MNIIVERLTHRELVKRGLLYSPLNIGSYSHVGNPFNLNNPNWVSSYRNWLNVNWKTNYKPLVNQLKTIVEKLKVTEGTFTLYTDTPVDNSHCDIVLKAVTKLAGLEEATNECS